MYNVYWPLHTEKNAIILLTSLVLNLKAAMMQQTPLVITQLKRCADSIPLQWYQITPNSKQIFLFPFFLLTNRFKSIYDVKALLLKQPLSCLLQQDSSHLFIPSSLHTVGLRLWILTQLSVLLSLSWLTAQPSLYTSHITYHSSHITQHKIHITLHKWHITHPTPHSTQHTD